MTRFLITDNFDLKTNNCINYIIMPTDVVYMYNDYINYQYIYHIILYIQVTSMYIAYLKMKHVSFYY
jgi:hypothetical protein